MYTDLFLQALRAGLEALLLPRHLEDITERLKESCLSAIGTRLSVTQQRKC